MSKVRSGVVAGRSLTCTLLVAAVGSAAFLSACASPLASSSDRGSSAYTNSLMAKSILSGTYTGESGNSPTIAQGVREVTRVDSPGTNNTPGNDAIAPADVAAVTQPTTAAATAGQPVPAGDGPIPPQALTTQPLGTTSDAADQIGLSASRLNMHERVFDLSLQDAISRTMKNSLAVKVEGFNPAIRETQIIQAESAFDAVLFGSSQYQNTDEPNVFTSGSTSNGTFVTSDIGIRKLLPSGGTAQVSTGFTYGEPLPALAGQFSSYRFGHYYEPNLNATLTQPLLRGFGTNVTEANIFLAQRDRRISLETFRRQVITQVANVEEAYHDLVLARTLVDIQEQLLAATEDTSKRVHDRILVDADQISLNQTIAAVEQRRAELIRARVNLRAASDKLKSLLNDPAVSIHDNVLVNPTDRPIAEPIVFSTAESIDTALRQRTEMQEVRLQLEKSDINIDVAKNGLLPKLDLTASIQANGLDQRIDNAFGDTVSDGHFLDYSAGVKFEVPIGNRLAESQLRQRKLERGQLLTQLVATAQNVILDVKTQLRELLASYQEVQARERARISAAEELKAITQKELISALTPEFLQLKLDAQASLATAEQNLIQAIVNYNVALMKLEQAKGTLLEFDRISLDRVPTYQPSDDFGKVRLLGKTFSLTN